MSLVLRAGLIGCGGMGREHLKILASIEGVQIAGVCDSREESARSAGQDFGVPFWTDLEAFLDEAGIDALHICSPTGMHGLQGIAAAKRGIHILSEKPLDIHLDTVDALIAECDKTGALLGCIFQRRAFPAARAVYESIADGSMGKILSCSVSVKWYRSQEYYNQDSWRGTWSLDGGALANQGIHSLDQMVWLAGPVEEVEYAHLDTVAHDIEVEDFALVVVRFANGARGTIEATTCCRPDLATRVEIYGTNGSAALDDARVIRFGIGGEDRLQGLLDHGVLTGGGADPWAISLAGHQIQIADFYQAIRDKRPPMVDGREARMSVDLLDKIYRKARPGAIRGH